MLGMLLQGLEKLLGPGLIRLSNVIYRLGLLLLILALLLPVWRLFLRWVAARAGVSRGCMVICPQCGRAWELAGPMCGGCGAYLELPLLARLVARQWTSGPWAQRLGLYYHAIGVTAFAGLTVWLIVGTGVFTATGSLPRLFLGTALAAMAAFGHAGGRALGLGPRGPLARAGAGLQALAAVGVLAVMVFLAGEAQPKRELVLTRFTVASGAARRPDTVAPTAEGEVGLEYLQLDHELLGYHRIVPLALVGQTTTVLPHGWLGRRMVPNLRRNVDSWERRGLTVRVRRDLRQVTPGDVYEVVASGGQVLIRRPVVVAR